jgi:hypothetical protein
MVVSKYVFVSPKKKDVSSPKEALSPGSEVDPNTMEAMFLDFTDSHKKILVRSHLHFSLYVALTPFSVEEHHGQKQPLALVG